MIRTFSRERNYLVFGRANGCHFLRACHPPCLSLRNYQEALYPFRIIPFAIQVKIYLINNVAS
jgi:hypothetical protein